MDHFEKYELLAEQGATSNEIFLSAKADGLNWVEQIKLLRQIFGLSLVEAKEVTIVADGLASSLSEYEARFIPAIEQIAREIEAEEAENDI